MHVPAPSHASRHYPNVFIGLDGFKIFPAAQDGAGMPVAIWESGSNLLLAEPAGPSDMGSSPPDGGAKFFQEPFFSSRWWKVSSSMISRFLTPEGILMRTESPSSLPFKPLPMGEAMEILPTVASAPSATTSS